MKKTSGRELLKRQEKAKKIEDDINNKLSDNMVKSLNHLGKITYEEIKQLYPEPNNTIYDISVRNLNDRS